MKRLIILVALCYSMTLCCAQIVGSWHGELSVGLQKLPLVFNISESRGAYAATLGSPLQGAKDIPAEIEVISDTIKISIPIIDAKYQGVYTDGVINGVFEQRGIRFNLVMEPGEYVMPRPQTPQPPYPYETREVTFENADDGYQLHGTLTLPLLHKAPFNKPCRAVVMVTGSGTQNRDEEILGHKPFAVLAHHLALNGIASLRYDDRGYGDDAAMTANVTTQTNTADAKAALKYMRDSVDLIDKIGVIGHSEGGTIAFILGADGDADFVVSLAGATIRGDSILMKQNERILGPQLGAAFTDAYIQALDRVLCFMRNNANARQWPEIDAELQDLQLPQQLVDNLKEIIRGRNQWIDYFISYDPSDKIKNVAVPVFAVNGALDVQVDSKQNLATLRKLLPDNQMTVIREYPGLNHLMQEASTGMPEEYGEIQQTISPQLMHDIAEWIRQLK